MFPEKSLFLFLFLFFLPSLPPAPSLESPQREARFRIFARAFRQASGFTSPVTMTFFVIWFTLMLLTPANYRANPNFQEIYRRYYKYHQIVGEIDVWKFLRTHCKSLQPHVLRTVTIMELKSKDPNHPLRL